LNAIAGGWWGRYTDSDPQTQICRFSGYKGAREVRVVKRGAAIKLSKRIAVKAAGWLLGLAVLVLRLTCRRRLHGDPRPALTKAGIRQVFGTTHAMQLAGSMAAYRGSGTMVSRSADGEILVPGLKLGGIVPIRGSSGRQAKGGAVALHRLITHAKQGHPVIMAIDGPRGPRGVVQKGIGLLAEKAEAVIVIAVAVPRRRWILTRTWDRTQIPKPFSAIDYYFSEPITPRSGESLERLATRVETALHELAKQHDPLEARYLVRRGEALPNHRRRVA
jgi:lysophospholipid acyltransferase (LPLAT)-like uncharacterized protein